MKEFMVTLILGVMYIRNSALKHLHFLHIREVMSVYDDDDDVSHVVEV